MTVDQYKNNKDMSKACLKFLDLADKFCQALKVEQNASEHTIRNYKNDLESFALWCDRFNLDPLNVEYRQFRNFLAEMDSAQYARTTINRRLSSLRSFYKWTQISLGLENDFADVMKAPKILKTLPHMVVHSDMDKLLACAKDDVDNAETDIKCAIAQRDYAIIELLYATGARISEVSNLKVEDIDFYSSQIKFFGKGQKERIVPIYSIAINALKEYLDNARPVLDSSNANHVDKNICFLGNRGGHMSADMMRKMFYAKKDKAGISSNISPHSIRHTFASDVLDGGADLRSVQEMLGHASLSTTQIYTHLSAKKLKDVHSLSHPRG